MLRGSTKTDFAKSINLMRVIYIVFGMVYLLSGILINFLQFLIYIFIRPFSKYLFRKLNYYLSYSLYSQIVFLLHYWAKVKVTLHYRECDKDQIFGKESALLIMNHCYEIDWMIGWVLCENFSILGVSYENLKPIAKKSLQYVPTLGYSWLFGGSIFVERNWEKDEKMFKSKLKDLISYEDPIWLVLTAEGTRFTPEKLEASNAFARKLGLPELRYHLTPRTRGFTTSIPIIRDKIPAIYNLTVRVKPGAVSPTLTNMLLGKSISAEFYVERIPTKNLPEGEAHLAAWLHSLYKMKDDVLHEYLKTGKWDSNTNTKLLKLELPRRIMPAVNFAFWSFCVLIPLGYLLIRLLMFGSLISVATAATIIGSFVYFLDKLVAETRISHASSYGMQKNT